MIYPNNKEVDSITFHFNANQVDDFIIKAARLEEQDYRILNFEVDNISYSILNEPDPPYHVTFHK